MLVADAVKIANLPDSGSPERVAFDLMKWLQNTVDKSAGKEALKAAYLDLYAECLQATRGGRPRH